MAANRPDTANMKERCDNLLNLLNKEFSDNDEANEFLINSCLRIIDNDNETDSTIFLEILNSDRTNSNALIVLFKKILFRKSDQELNKILNVKIQPYLDAFPIEQQQALANTLLNMGVFNVVISMREQEYSVTDADFDNARKWKLLLDSSVTEQSERKMSDEDSAIQKLIPMPLNPRHLELYKKDKNEGYQKDFINYHQKQVKFTATYIKNKMETVADATILFECIAKQRARFAYINNSPNSQAFGLERHSRMTTEFRSPTSPYYPYKALLGEEKAKNNTWGDGGLTSMNTSGWTHYEPESNCISTLAEKYLILCRTRFENKESAAKAFGSFHWEAANTMPWARGSAAIIDQLVDGLWIHHFQWAPIKKAGVSLDCQALSSTREEYMSGYPNFPPPSKIYAERATLAIPDAVSPPTAISSVPTAPLLDVISTSTVARNSIKTVINLNQESLATIVKTLIAYIENKGGKRLTSGKGSPKIQNLNILLERINKIPPATWSAHEGDLLNEVMVACSHKRHALHFWKDPDSVTEFTELLKKYQIPLTEEMQAQLK